jgi:hypothetical protein
VQPQSDVVETSDVSQGKPVIAHPSSFIPESRRNDAMARSRIHSNETSDAALVAWLASRGRIEKASDEDDSIDADSVGWSEDFADSLEPIDSVFEVLGAAVA